MHAEPPSEPVLEACGRGRLAAAVMCGVTAAARAATRPVRAAAEAQHWVSAASCKAQEAAAAAHSSAAARWPTPPRALAQQCTAARCLLTRTSGWLLEKHMRMPTGEGGAPHAQQPLLQHPLGLP